MLSVFELSDARLLELASRYAKLAAVPRLYAGFDARVVDVACRRASVAAVCRHDPGYPAALAGLKGAPPVLFCAGDRERLAELLEAPAAAVVGARKASDYALEVASGLARGLASAGVTVVSGMADGVDSAAHRGAFESSGTTVAVLGGSADVAYPAEKRALHRRLVSDAAVVSEWPPGFRPRPWCFVARNRIIAGLAAAVIVVEAGERSGSLTTARFAAAYGRAVAAVPGRVTSEGAGGSNALLFDGAHMVRDAHDALELVCGHALGDADLKSWVARLRRAPDDAPDLPDHLRRLLTAIDQGSDAQAQLFELSDDGTQVLAGLSELELLGLLRRGPDGRYIRTAGGVRLDAAQYPGPGEHRTAKP